MVTFKNVRNATLFALQAQEFLVSANWSENIVEHPSACKLVSKGIQIFNGLRVRMVIFFYEYSFLMEKVMKSIQIIVRETSKIPYKNS